MIEGARSSISEFDFELDGFQVAAMQAVDRTRSVLVSAPTGSGKTLIADHAVDKALQAGGKAFYTTPLKALSNQKLGDLGARLGTDMVGLLTGDIALRAEARVVVMTTEVLRNMILADSPLLDGLRTVVLDEVHFLQDPYRGGVWEEVLVLAPPSVRFVCLSATIGNVDELGAWLNAIRGPTDIVVERERPVRLHHHLAVDHRRHTEAGTELLPLLRDGTLSPEAAAIDVSARRAARARPRVPRWRTSSARGDWLPFRTPRRSDIVMTLDELEMLPAIVFIFSRAACDDAVRQCLNAGIRLTDPGRRRAIVEVAERRTQVFRDDELDDLDYSEWLEGLEAGIAAHHAGLVPAFRETIEECFSRELLRVVFATETLSLGINMPARTVVIERFSKYGAAGRARLTPGEYAQLTGRAGRRGMDDEGHAVTLWRFETAVQGVARCAVDPPADLRSAFRPSYNLVVNLVELHERDVALKVIRQSFGQWQTDHARGVSTDDAHAVSDRHVDQFIHRLAVLEELGYVEGWSVTPRGAWLARIYHDVDLLVAEVLLTAEILDEADEAMFAGVMSTLVFERRRARRHVRPHPHARSGQARSKVPSGGERLGARRRADLDRRAGLVARCAERVRAVEQVHLVPHQREPDAGLAPTVISWARGAPLGTVLSLAGETVGETAPGDLVRHIRQVADLCEQIAEMSSGTVKEAAGGASRRLLRGVAAVTAMTEDSGEESAVQGVSPHVEPGRS